MRFFWAISIAAVVVGCSRKEAPPSVLSQVKMREVRWDMVRADQYVSDFFKDTAVSKRDESLRLYEAVFKIHKITREQFKESLHYYSSRPDLFQPIIDSLAKRKMFMPLQPSEGRGRDTLNKLKKDSLQKLKADSLRKPKFRKSVPVKTKLP